MKLAEGLILRADAQKRILQLRERLNRIARIQEGEEAAENLADLLAELDRALATLREMIRRINRTNAATAFDDKRTLTDALADRDVLSLERGVLEGLIGASTVAAGRNYYVPEAKSFRNVNVAELQARVDRLARDYRELDTRIQAMNWAVDLLD